MRVRQQVGYLCASYGSTDARFITAHNCQNCVNVQVSLIHCGLAEFTARACFTLNQCETPFAKGVFCTQARVGTTTYEQVGVQVSGNQQQVTRHEFCSGRAWQCVCLCLEHRAGLCSVQGISVTLVVRTLFVV